MMSLKRKSCPCPSLNLLSQFGTLALPKKTKSIENIQILAFKIILQSDYFNYQQACKHFSALPLADRRDKLCLKFAKKNLKSEKKSLHQAIKQCNKKYSFSKRAIQHHKIQEIKYTLPCKNSEPEVNLPCMN